MWPAWVLGLRAVLPCLAVHAAHGYLSFGQQFHCGATLNPNPLTLNPSIAKVRAASQQPSSVSVQMPDLTILPDGRLFLCNGAQVGKALPCMW